MEYVEDWDVSQEWLDYLAGPASSDLASADWHYSRPEPSYGKVAGFDQTTLIIGGAVGAGAVAAVALAGGGGGTKDTIAPAAPTALDLATDDDTGSNTTDNATNKTSAITISGSAEAGSSVELFDGATSLGKATASGTGAFTFEISLTEGNHAILARATDLAGNVSSSSSALSVRVDTTAPVAVTNLSLAAADDTGASNSDRITQRNSALTISGTTEAGALVELFDGTVSLGTATAGADGLFTRDVALAEGVHAVTVIATDTAGNLGVAIQPMAIVVDTTAPTAPSSLDLSAEDDNGASSSDNITSLTTGLSITGLAEPNATVNLFNGATPIASILAGSNGIFTVDVPLPVGTHTITSRGVDAAGNVGPSSGALTIQVVAAAQSSSAAAPLSETLFADNGNMLGTEPLAGTGTIA